MMMAILSIFLTQKKMIWKQAKAADSLNTSLFQLLLSIYVNTTFKLVCEKMRRNDLS